MHVTLIVFPRVFISGALKRTRITLHTTSFLISEMPSAKMRILSPRLYDLHCNLQFWQFFLPLFILWLFTLCLVRIYVMKMQEQRDLFPGALEMMILQTLKRKPLHGYALAQHIKQTSEDLLQVE